MEQRKHPRREVTIMADYLSPHVMTLDYLRDLSMGGAFLYTDRMDSIGTTATILFHIPTSTTTISAKAEVVWVRPSETVTTLTEPGMGIRFREISEKDREALSQFLRFYKVNYI